MHLNVSPVDGLVRVEWDSIFEPGDIVDNPRLPIDPLLDEIGETITANATWAAPLAATCLEKTGRMFRQDTKPVE